jgi:hypothetical protein
MSIDLTSEIEKITDHRLPERHTYFQLQYFLIGKEPTVQAKMWRCIRELKARRESIEALKLEIEDVNDDLLLINMKIEQFVEETPEQQIKKRKLERKKTGLNGRLKNLKDRLASVEEESIFLVKAFRSLERIEPLKDHDDVVAQKTYWNDKLTQEFNLRHLFGMPLDLELVKTILALNSDAPIKQDALHLIEERQADLERRRQNIELEKVMEATLPKMETKSQELNGISIINPQ